MAHFAKIGLNSKVIDVVTVSDQELHDSNGVEREVIGVTFLTNLTGWAIWKQSSYNTRAGVHYEPNSNTPSSDQSKALRKNTACVGGTYDEDRDAFIPPQPYPSWVLVNSTCQWEPPVPMPADGATYGWDENTISWERVII